VASLLSKQIRVSDFLSRYAGDEFVVILHTNANEVREFVHRIQQSVDNHEFQFSGAGLHLGISVGWACFGVDGDSLDEMLLAADRSMYADKFRRKALPVKVNAMRKATFSYDRVM